MRTMHRLASGLMLLVCSAAIAQQTPPQEQYPRHPDSVRQEGVPQGEVVRFSYENSKIFPGTFREYSIYIPAQYKPEAPACVWVNQDGPGPAYNAPILFDNLIHKKQMPVTIGIFIGHGQLRPLDANSALPRMNRSFEYDGLGDNYVRFLLEELLPDVETKKASDGRAIRLSKSGNDRGIGGASSGAIAAFTAAWERPNEFSRVFSAIGTYVGLRGGNEYSTLIRKYEPKPIRVFLQDGSNDNNSYGGDWWMANQAMERSLIFSGYEVDHVWGSGAHNGQHATAIFPDAMKFLWKDYPAPVRNGPTQNAHLNQVLLPGGGWKLVGEGYGVTQGAAVNPKGEVFFNDTTARKTYKIGLDGKPVVFLADSKGATGLAFSADGKLFAAIPGDQKVVSYDSERKSTTIAEGFRAFELAVAPNGNIYVTNPPATNANDPSNLFLIKPDGSRQQVDTGLTFGGGVTLTPDKSLLYVPDHRSHWIYSYQIQPDGTLANKQQYGHLHVPDYADKSGAYTTAVDRNGRVYVATFMGIQVTEQLGKVICILPAPDGRGRVWTLAFGGENFDTIFAFSGEKAYSRKLNVRGAPAWAPATKPAPPRL